LAYTPGGIALLEAGELKWAMSARFEAAALTESGAYVVKDGRAYRVAEGSLEELSLPFSVEWAQASGEYCILAGCGDDGRPLVATYVRGEFYIDPLPRLPRAAAWAEPCLAALYHHNASLMIGQLALDSLGLPLEARLVDARDALVAAQGAGLIWLAPSQSAFPANLTTLYWRSWDKRGAGLEDLVILEAPSRWQALSASFDVDVSSSGEWAAQLIYATVLGDESLELLGAFTNGRALLVEGEAWEGEARFQGSVLVLGVNATQASTADTAKATFTWKWITEDFDSLSSKRWFWSGDVKAEGGWLKLTNPTLSPEPFSWVASREALLAQGRWAFRFSLDGPGSTATLMVPEFKVEDLGAYLRFELAGAAFTAPKKAYDVELELTSTEARVFLNGRPALKAELISPSYLKPSFTLQGPGTLSVDFLEPPKAGVEETVEVTLQTYQLPNSTRIARLPAYPEGFFSWGVEWEVGVEGFTKALRLSDLEWASLPLTEALLKDRFDSWLLWG